MIFSTQNHTSPSTIHTHTKFEFIKYLFSLKFTKLQIIHILNTTNQKHFNTFSFNNTTISTHSFKTKFENIHILHTPT